MSLTVCMVGCGAFAEQFHGPAQVACAQADAGLVRAACCDPQPERARAYARTFGFARAYERLEEMLAAERPDAVVMAVPPVATAAVASTILARGFPLLLEKPPGNTVVELNRIVAAAAASRGRAQVGFNRRYMPVLRKAREILERDFALAAPFHLRVEMVRQARWDADFSTTAVHAIDAARVLADSAFRTARFTYAPQLSEGRRALNAEIELECVSGLRVSIAVVPVGGMNRETARLHALDQTLELTLPFPSGPFATGQLEHWRKGDLVESFSDADRPAVERMGILDETREFFARVRRGQAFDPELADCRQTVALMEALRSEATALEFSAESPVRSHVSSPA